MTRAFEKSLSPFVLMEAEVSATGRFQAARRKDDENMYQSFRRTGAG